MLLTTTNLVHYLISRGLIALEAVVDGPLGIVDFGRRNRDFKVFVGEGPGLFLKQLPGPVESPAGGPTRELACHRLARSRREYTPLLHLMPRFRDHDPDRRVLIVELLHPAEDLRSPDPTLQPGGASTGLGVVGCLLVRSKTNPFRFHLQADLPDGTLIRLMWGWFGRRLEATWRSQPAW